MQPVNEHLPVDMTLSKALQDAAVNQGQIFAQNIHVPSKDCVDDQNMWTTRPRLKLVWKRLEPFRVLKQVSPYACTLELPAAIQIY